MDDRIAIVGANGQGKTTLVKSIAQRLALLSGGRRASRNLRIGYFSQDQLDELREGENVLDHVRDLMPEAGQAQVRAVAAHFGFGPEKVETRVENLSGGEKVRLLLGLTTYRKPHILILDEPTSHLDIDSREALIYALNDFSGAVLLITHDTYLAEATADRLWLVKDGRASPYEGDIADYKALVLAADRQPDASASAAKKPQSSRSGSTAPTKPSNKVRMRLEAAELEIEKARSVLEGLDRELADPAIYARKADAEARLKARAKAQLRLEEAETEWLAAGEAMEAAERGR